MIRKLIQTQTHSWYCFLAMMLFVVSCGSSEQLYDYTPSGETHVYYEINDEIPVDDVMSTFLAPYVMEMRNEMGQFLTTSDGLFEKAVPEGPLGNLAADIIRFRATSELHETVHVSVMHNNGLQMPLPEGEVTVGHIYGIIPSDIYITVLKFTGEQLVQIAGELAAVNGEPVSGIRFRVVDGYARDILLNTRNIEYDRHYWLATSNWLADGGGNIPALWNPLERRNLDILVRDAFIEYLRGREVISPYVDHRIRN